MKLQNKETTAPITIYTVATTITISGDAQRERSPGSHCGTLKKIKIKKERGGGNTKK
jgi:hypothetical protein